MPLNHGNRHGLPCGCVFLLLLDDTQPQESAVWDITENVCPRHIHLTTEHTQKLSAKHAQITEDKMNWMENHLNNHHAELLQQHKQRINPQFHAMVSDRLRKIVSEGADREARLIERQLAQRKQEVMLAYAQALIKPYALVNIYDQVIKDNGQVTA